jgi:chromate transporter
MNPLTVFALVFRSALISTGGMGNVPLLHDDLVRRGLATDREFAESLAVGQVSPGPNGLWVVCLGYFLGGWMGALAALVAIALPPFLILVIAKLYERHRHHPAVGGFMAGLEVAVISIFGVVMASFLAAAPHTAFTVVIAALAFLAILSGRVPTLIVIVLAGVIGAALK